MPNSCGRPVASRLARCERKHNQLVGDRAGIGRDERDRACRDRRPVREEPHGAAPHHGPCLIQPLHDPHCLAYCAIQATICSHHCKEPDGVAVPGDDEDTHCSQVVRILPGLAHISVPSPAWADIHDTISWHQSDGGAPWCG